MAADLVRFSGRGSIRSAALDARPHAPSLALLVDSDHSATAVVNGQTFQDWFVDSYMFNEVGSSPLVSGFFW